MLWLYAFALLAGCLAARRLCRRWKYDLHRIPSAPGLPLLGGILELAAAKDLSVVFRKWNNHLGYPKAFKVGTRPCGRE